MTDDAIMHIVSMGLLNDPHRPEDNTPRHRNDMYMNVGNGRAICTTIPAVNRTPKDVLLRDGTSEIMLDAATKRKLYAQKDFPKPLTQPASPAHRISPAEKKGLGMFATRALSAGDLILAERPLMVRALGPPPYTGPQMGLFRNPPSLVSRVVEMEFQIDVMVQRMVPKNRNAFLALTNSPDFSGCGNLVGRMYTNGRDVLQGFTFSGMPGGSATYTGLFDKLSRVNHSCTPNAVFTWDSPSFSGSLRAIRDIQPDEEITITYCNPSLSTAERGSALAPYNIKCDCPACKDGSASDARRDDIFAKFDKVQELESNEAKREMLLSVIELIEKEGAEVLPEYYEANRLLLKIYREEKAAEEEKEAEKDSEKEGDSLEAESKLDENKSDLEEKGTEKGEEEKESEEKEGESKETESKPEEEDSQPEEKGTKGEEKEEKAAEGEKESGANGAKSKVEGSGEEEKGEEEGHSKETESDLAEKEKSNVDRSELEEQESEPEEKEGDTEGKEDSKVEEKKEGEVEGDESEPEEKHEPVDKVKALEQKLNALSLAKFGRAFLRE
ncbi:hypothetical protein EV715DRAFT_277359 [Schizophyllum commune]